MKTVPAITENEFAEATDNSMGWCPKCREFTRDCTEPDAEGYDCEQCGENSVVGAEVAMVAGMFDFREEEE
jgi:hypothetical protein